MRTTQEQERQSLTISPDIELRVAELRARASGVLESLLDSTAFTPLDEFLDNNPDCIALKGQVVLVKISDVHERKYRHYRPGLQWDRSSSDRGGVPSEPHRTDDEIRWSAQRNISVQLFSQDQFDDLCTVCGSEVLVRDRLGLDNKFSESDNVPIDWNSSEKRGFYQEDKQQWEAASFLIIQDAAFLPEVIALSGLSKIDPVRRTHEVYSSYRDEPDAAIPLPPIQLLETSDAFGQTLLQRLIEQGRKIFSPNAYGIDQHYREISAQVIFSQGAELPISFSEGRETRNYSRPVGRSDRSNRQSDRGFAGYDSVHEWREATFGDVRETWNPTREGGFGGYASKSDWHKATLGD
jgi:hypothetical protein